MSEVINIHDYTYTLPAERIAAQPLQQRDESKLLVYRQGSVEHHTFKNLADFLPAESFLFFNDTKVIPARLHFQKETGAAIELFLLNPVLPNTLLATVMLAQERCTWKCAIGNVKRWKDDQPLSKKINSVTLTASLIDRTEGIVEFTWNSNMSFAEVLTVTGVTPLPPYIKREANQSDVKRYQTIYSQYDGAVAAPTAGLHFTDHVFESLKKKKIEYDFLTLHVSAGTFQPVKVDNALEHTMHHEQVIIQRQTITHLLTPGKFRVAVGTTSMRTLESLYWYGVVLLKNPKAVFKVTQHDPYVKQLLPSPAEALQAVAHRMDTEKSETLTGTTSIYIHPGYGFKICNGLITNFHQPGSTLMLLVASLVGSDWKRIYDEALQRNYRFLSYGDSSLLIP